MTQNIKQIVITIVIIVIAFVGFKMFFSNDEATGVALTADQNINSEFVDGQTILILLNKLNRVTLDNSIFTNKIFTSLVNFERPISEQAIGRPNPFLPIGTDSAVQSTISATTTNRE